MNGTAVGAAPPHAAIPYTVAPEVAPLWDATVQQCVDTFMEWLARESHARNLPVAEARISRWRSFEDERDEHLAIEADVRGASDSVAEFWGAACDELAELVGRNPTPATQLLIVDFYSR